MKGWLVVILIVGVFYGFSAWSDYTWDTRYIEAVGDDWRAFDKQENFIDPIFVYTIFVQPVHRMGLIQKSSVKSMDKGYYQYNLRWVDREFGGGGDSKEFLYFTDCINGLEGYLNDDVDESNFVYEDIEWQSSDDNKYVTSEDDKKMLREKFEAKCKILETNN